MKTAIELPKDLVRLLRPGDVQLYLTSRGWLSEPYGKGGKGLCFHHPAIPKIDLLLPLKRELSDYAARMAELVTALTTIEGRSWSEVVNDLTGPSADVVRLRVSAPDATLGNYPLDDGIQLLQGGRELILAAAYSTIRPEALHPQRKPREVTEFMESCRLGQTERGSFIATIIAPVPPEIQKTIDFGDDKLRIALEPYERRVTTRLMSALGMVSSAIQAGEPDKILSGVSEGISANLCEALDKMQPSGDQSSLDISMSWARTRSLVPDSVPKEVCFPKESFGWLKEASRKLRIRTSAKRKEYHGKLIIAHALDRPLLPEVAGKIVIAAEVDGQTARINVDLNQDDFKLACAALPDRGIVSVTGVIRQDVKVREFELSEPSDFQVLERS